MDDYLRLPLSSLVIATSLIAVNGAISVALRLQLERRLFWAALRTVVQLLLVGLVLQSVFRWQSPWLVLLWGTVMTAVAGLTAAGRVEYRYPRLAWDSLVAVGASCWLMALVAVAAVVRNRPWYDPQYFIPLLGMLLGNTLNGLALGMDRFTHALAAGRVQIEGRLALGATGYEAAQPHLVEAVRTGMLPIINSMTVVGLVSLPGMMTGQLLAGVAPVEAVKYQIVIMFLIAAATALGTVLAVFAGYRRLFNPWSQFLFQRLHRRST